VGNSENSPSDDVVIAAQDIEQARGGDFAGFLDEEEEQVWTDRIPKEEHDYSTKVHKS
jgi:hypothetical protein